MAILPVNKAFRVVVGATFDYSFQYLLGVPDDATPIDLTGYTGVWTLHTPNGNTVYNSSAMSGHSGVFFGGQPHTPTNGIIDLVIVAADTSAITWESVSYNFVLTSPSSFVTNLLTGSVTVINVVP